MNDTDNAPLRFEEEERLPWLEPIDDVEESGGSLSRLFGLVVAGLIGIGLVVGGLWWWQNNGGRPRGELIAAPEGDYKVAPAAEPGRFDGEGNVAVAAAEGVSTPGNVDASQLPEQPVAPTAGAATVPVTPPATPTRGPVALPTARPTVSTGAASAPVAAAPAAAPAAASGGGMVQIGAFASEATAAHAWDSLKGRFTWLANVNRSIVPAQVNGRTVYRLRGAAGSASAARDLCARMRVAGENCIVVP
jgi:hypothetical protein